MDIIIYKDGQPLTQFKSQQDDIKIFQFFHENTSRSIDWNLNHEGYQVLLITEDKKELMEPCPKSNAASHALQLMDKDYTYPAAVKAAAEALKWSIELLEIELNKYI